MLPPSGTKCNLKSWWKEKNSWLLIDILKYTKQMSLYMMKKNKMHKSRWDKNGGVVNWEFIFIRNPAGGDILCMIFQLHINVLFFFVFSISHGTMCQANKAASSSDAAAVAAEPRDFNDGCQPLALSVWSLGHGWARRLLGGNEFQKAASIIHIYKRTAWPLLLEMRLNEGRPYLGAVLLKCHRDIFLIRSLSPCWTCTIRSMWWVISVAKLYREA